MEKLLLQAETVFEGCRGWACTTPGSVFVETMKYLWGTAWNWPAVTPPYSIGGNLGHLAMGRRGIEQKHEIEKRGGKAWNTKCPQKAVGLHSAHRKQSLGPSSR